MTQLRLQELRALADPNSGTAVGDLWNAIEDLAAEIDRLRAVVRVNARRAGAAEAEIAAVLDRGL